MNKLLVLIAFISLSMIGSSQSKFALNDVIAIAHGESISSKKVQNTFENKYWQYFSYKRSFLPSLTFNGTLPNLNVGISEVVKEDGTRDFVRTSNVNYSAAFQINQPIRWTGGDIFISTDLARLDILGGNNRTSYKASPFYIGYRQPIMKFNGYKWQSKIEPLEFEEAKKKSVEQNEDVSIEAVRLFFETVNNSSRY
ncbi:MAG: outer membrane protein, partial [Urechidicola sp.]